LQPVTIIIAALALVVSLLSLGWQMFTFSRSGRRASVFLSIGWRGAGAQLILQSIKRRDDPLDCCLGCRDMALQCRSSA
jgi:hypothetical protein